MNLDFDLNFQWQDENVCDVEGLSIPASISKKHRIPLLEENADAIWVTQNW